MKKIFTIISLVLTVNSFAQNNVYIVTEKYDGQIGFLPSFDSVFVTSPQGITTSYSIPNYISNTAAHDSQFNNILNGIINQGYRVMEMGDWHFNVNNSLLGGHYIFELRTIFLGQPWTSAGLEPAGANNLQFKIIEVFPNPCDQFMNIKLSEKMTNTCLVIISADGYIIQKSEINDDDIITLDVSKYSPGAYFIRLVNDKFYTEAVKVVIQ